MVVHEGPDAAGFLDVPIDLHGPAFEGGFAFPEEAAVAVETATIVIVAGADVAQQADVEEIGRARPKLERGEIAFVKRAGVAPDPADAVFLEEVNDLRPMPAGVAEIDGEAKVAR